MRFFKIQLVFILIFFGNSVLGRIIYVDDDAPTGGKGTSWSSARKYLQDALEE